MNDRLVDGMSQIDERTRLEVWQSRRSRSDSEYSEEAARIDVRENLYKGERKLKPLVKGDAKPTGDRQQTPHVNNIVFENIESMISTSIPTPKVTAMRQEDEGLAAVIEHWLRNELDRLPFETMNDMAERTVPIQGGCGWLVEWDNRSCTHRSTGALKVTQLHPKLFCPQPGVYTGIQDMDWFIIKVPTTKASVRREYGVDVDNLSEEQPELRSSDGTATQEETLTKYVGYEKNEDGGVDRFVWVNSTVLENIENYQARHQEVCRSCHRKKPLIGQVISNSVSMPGGLLPDPESGAVGGLIPQELLEMQGAMGVAGVLSERELSGTADEVLLGGVEIKSGQPPEPVKYTGGPCPWCGSEDWTDAESEYEEILLPMHTAGGTDIPGPGYSLDENGKAILKPTLIPYYKPDLIPVVLQRNVSVYGRLLGGSDVDAIEDQQNTTNRIEKKIIDRVVKAGTRITLPPDPSVRLDTEDSEVIRLKKIEDRQFIGTYDFTGNIENALAYKTAVYEEARRQLGITNSFQGREDRTATSGVAKEFQAAQSAGRLESKRVMKGAAYAELFEMMFKFMLAYSDEPRSVRYRDHKGDVVYETFNRYDFLKKDADGAYYWDVDFLFSVDSNQALESNRAAMWQETRMNLQTGAFGDPTQLDTLILFWSKMEELHYPGAGATRKYLEEKLEEQQAQAAQTPAAGGGPRAAEGVGPYGGASQGAEEMPGLPGAKTGTGNPTNMIQTGGSL